MIGHPSRTHLPHSGLCPPPPLPNEGPKICISSRLLVKLKVCQARMAEAAFRGRKDIPVPTRSERSLVRTQITCHDSAWTRRKGVFLESQPTEPLWSAIMHTIGIMPITARYGNLHEDYHSVAANPSFAGHGTWFSFTAPYGSQPSLILILNHRHCLRFQIRMRKVTPLVKQCIH